MVALPEYSATTARTANGPANLEWLLRILWTRKGTLFLMLLLGGMLGAGVAQVLTKRWEAIALVRIGEVTQIQPGISVESVESPLRATERLRDPGFKRALLERIRREAPDLERDARRLMTGLRSNLLRGADLVEVRVDGSSVEAARRLAGFVVEELRRAHADLYEARVGLLRSRIAQVETQLREANAERQALDRVSAGRGGGASTQGFSESVHLASLLAENDEVRRTLSALTLALDYALSPGRTFATGLLSEIYVPENATAPRLPIFILAGAFSGFFLGLVWLAAARRDPAPVRRSP